MVINVQCVAVYTYEKKAVMTNFKGLLIVGDPHTRSKPIGKRKKTYTAESLDKLTQIKDIANSNEYLTLILGDFFQDNGENNIPLLNKLFKLLKQFKHTPICLEGNHDKLGISIDDEDTLNLFKTAGLLTVVDTTQAMQVVVRDFNYKIYFVPNGHPLPFEGCSDFPSSTETEDTVTSDVKKSIMITHHDLAMGSSYPGAIQIKEIKDIDYVINGHMHDTKNVVECGKTLYHNPGNIEPLSIDLKNHIPRVWLFDGTYLDPKTGVLKPIDLTYNKDMFDLTGLRVAASSAETGVADLVSLDSPAESEDSTAESQLEDSTLIELKEHSDFAEKIKKAKESAPTKSEGTEDLKKSIEEIEEISDYSKPAFQLLGHLLAKLDKK